MASRPPTRCNRADPLSAARGKHQHHPSQIRAYWSRLVFTGRAQPPREAADADEVRRLLQSTPGAIAYLPLDAARDPELVILLELD